MMDSVKIAISKACSQWRLAMIVYVIQFLLAMTMGMQLYQVFEASIGDSLELDKLLSNYNHTVIQDLLKVHGGAITSIIGQSRYLIITYLIFSVFVHASLIHAVHHGHTRFRDFWTGGALYFFKFLSLSLLFLIVYLIGLIVVGILASFVFNGILEMPSERVGFAWLGVIAFVFLIFLLKVFAASTYAKMAIIDHDKSPLRAFLFGWRQLRRNWKATYGIILPLLLIQFMVYGIYLCLESQSGMTTVTLILVFFIFQQAMIFFRCIWKLMIYNGLHGVYMSEDK